VILGVFKITIFNLQQLIKIWLVAVATRLITCFRLLQWLVTCKDFKLPEDGSN